MALDLIDGRFQLIKKLGEGSFGQVFLAFDSITEWNVAIKMDTDPDQSNTQTEADFYEILEGVEGTPRILATGRHRERNYMAMELLGKDLFQIKNEVHLSTKNILFIAIQLITILQRIHSKGIVHRDLKPSNIMFNKYDINRLYIVDFGLAKRFIDDDGAHDDFGNATRVGTIPYASLNCHHGKSQSRRDDLEALGYVLLALLNGNVPWLMDPAEETFDNVLELKSSYSTIEMFEGHSIVFKQYMDYCKSLGYKDEPDYLALIGLFQAELTRLCFDGDEPTYLPTYHTSRTYFPIHDIAPIYLPIHDTAPTYLPTDDTAPTYITTDDTAPTYLPTDDTTPTYIHSDDIAPTYLPTDDTTPTYIPSDDIAPTYLPTYDTAPTYLPTYDTAPTYIHSDDIAPTYFPTYDTAPTYLPTYDTAPTYIPSDHAPLINLPTHNEGLPNFNIDTILG